MFRFICFLYILLFFPIVANARDRVEIDKVLDRLDSVIDAAPSYEAVKLSRIAKLNGKLKTEKNLENRYIVNMQLYDEYRSYQSDSAVSCLDKCFQLAKQLNRKDLMNDCLSLIAYQSSSSGRYPDARAMLLQVDKSQLKGRGFFYYYRAQNHLFSEIAYYSHLKIVKDTASAKADRYESLLLKSIDKHSQDYYLYQCRHFFNKGNFAEALRVNDKWLAVTPESSRDYAFVTYYRYLIYITLKNYEQAEYWVARSAISDITHGVMDQGSLWSLADYISGRDINRSYKYIRFAWTCASKFGTSVRAAQISPVLSVIEAEYKTSLDKANHRLTLFLVLISVLAVVLVFMLYYVTKQRRRLAFARNDLRKKNEELADTNTKLADSNVKLKDANERVTATNAQLHESDQIKEAYIGRFLALCSEYVDRIDKTRRDANKLIKAHKIDELYQMTRSSEQKDKDVEQLYGYFDSTFLNIFPTFVADFNALLKPENRIEAPDGKLNTTLRIFALIRLGIDDSGKIAEFLHYSVNTIYNYRARTKNGCLGNRDTFEDEVKRLGKI